MLLDHPDGFDGLARAADIVGIAGTAGEHQRIDDDVFGLDAVLGSQQLYRTLRDRQFALAGECLRLQLIFVDGADNQRRAIGLCNRADLLEFLIAIFQVDRVNDALALAVGERQLDGLGIGGVDHDRRLAGGADQFLVEERDVGHLVAVGGLKANVDDMGAVLYLAPRDLDCLFPFLGGDQVLEGSRADHIGALADDQRTAGLFYFHHLRPAEVRAVRRRFDHARLASVGHLGDSVDVLLGGAAAAADDVEPAVADEAVQVFREGLRGFPGTCRRGREDPRWDSTRR